MGKLINVCVAMTCIITLSVVNSVNAQIPSNNLVAHWSFNGNANDISGNGHHGTLNNVISVPGQSGSPNTGMYFNGSSTSYVSVPFSGNFNVTSYSICAVVGVAAFNTATPCQSSRILQRGSGTPASGHYFLEFQDNGYDSTCANTGDTSNYTFASNCNTNATTWYKDWQYSPTIRTNTWYCVVATYNAGTYKIFVNGVLKINTTVPSPVSIGTNSEGIRIGCNTFSGPGSYWFRGVMDDVALYGRALADTEVTQYCAGINYIDTTVYIVPPLIDSLQCGANFNVNYGVTANFNSGNTFTAQLSNSAGSFATPVNIGSVNSNTAGSISCTAPSGISNGTGYRIRVVASSPARTSQDNGTNIVSNLPVAYAGKDTAVCPGAVVQLNASGGTSYTWYPGDSMSNPNSPNPTLPIHGPATYYVSVTKGTCKDTAAITITVIGNSFNLFPKNPVICKGETVSLLAMGGDKYYWEPYHNISDTTIYNPTVRPDSNTTYWVTISEPKCNYMAKLPITIKVNPNPDVKIAAANDINCEGSFAKLSVTGADNYYWSPAEGLDDVRSANPVANPEKTTMYTVKGVSKEGCSDTAMVNVAVRDENSAVIAPNAFSPNGDGINDCFEVKLQATGTDFELAIFNRWGKRVFFSKNPADCWDGTHKGTLQDIGTFFFYYKYLSPTCGEVVGKGNLHLIR
jgi:gliding motility-associated-like protein